MKRFLGVLATSLMIISFSWTAQAGFLIEPFIGYGVSGDYDQGSTYYDLSTTMFGARAGLTMLGFMYGLEYATGSLSVGTSPETSGDSTDLGAFVGFEFPIMIRVWATYYFQSSMQFDGGSKINGSGTKLGVGYTGLPFVSINFEMLNRTYDEFDSSSVVLSPEVTHSTFLLGISLPLP